MKTILITGASRGIGLALVQKFQKLGWNVAACARSEEIKKSGADLPLICDVTDLKEVRATVEKTLEKFGRIDALVNNAGMAGSNSLDIDSAPEFGDDLWFQIIATNLTGTYYFSKQVLPHLPDGTGRIVNVGSVLSLKGAPDQTAYTAAKHGVLGFTRALARFLAPRRITVNAVCPGWVRTEMSAGRIKDFGISAAELEKTIPLGTMTEPSEVADFIATLIVSEASAKITGQALTIDGGSTA